MSGDDDQSLLRRVSASGDEAAFRTLYQRHTPALYRLALRLLGGSSGEAEDAVQESWIRASGALSSFRGDSSLRTWVSGIVVNACREMRRAREPKADGDRVEPAGPRTYDGERIDLERAVSALPDGYREVVVLHDVEGYTHEDIGRLLGIDPGTSKSQLSRARRALRASLSRPPALRDARAGREGG
jgi:RNA polymerase sigma-70 factor, ECF subfamily